jgi:hypothetical protein
LTGAAARGGTDGRPGGLLKVTIPPVGASRAQAYAGALLAVVVLGLGSVAGANYVVDPRSEFQGTAYRPLAPDWPMEKLQRYDALDEPPQALVVGTSRGMALRGPPDVPDNESFNLAFPGGEIVAESLVVGHLRGRHGPPGSLVYVLDQFALRPQDETRFERSRAYGIVGGPELPWWTTPSTLLGSLDVPYLLDTARVLRYTHVTGFPEPTYYGLDDHGQYEPAFAEVDGRIANGTVDLEGAVERLNRTLLVRLFGQQTAPDEDLAARFTAFVAQAQGSGTRVQVVLPPFEPGTLRWLRTQPGFDPLYQGALQAALDACPAGIEVYDYTDVRTFGGSPVGFMDSHHITALNGRLIQEAMARGDGELCGAAAPA